MKHAFGHDAVRASCGNRGVALAESRPDDLVGSVGTDVVMAAGRGIGVGRDLGAALENVRGVE